MSTSISVKRLDEIADQLGSLYQTIGRMSFEKPDPHVLVGVMDDLVRITAALEHASGRKKRERKSRKVTRQQAR